MQAPVDVVVAQAADVVDESCGSAVASRRRQAHVHECCLQRMAQTTSLRYFGAMSMVYDIRSWNLARVLCAVLWGGFSWRAALESGLTY
jgi:hypothetical protein